MSFSIACITKCYDFLRPEAIACGSSMSWPFEEVRKIFARLQKAPQRRNAQTRGDFFHWLRPLGRGRSTQALAERVYRFCGLPWICFQQHVRSIKPLNFAGWFLGRDFVHHSFVDQAIESSMQTQDGAMNLAKPISLVDLQNFNGSPPDDLAGEARQHPAKAVRELRRCCRSQKPGHNHTVGYPSQVNDSCHRGQE